nr:isopentenyl-diphosphate Delta-isomerase [uncultured Cohaesibacter sp.]
MSNINVILVDENDTEIGEMDKLAAHLNQGTLHRAFSLHVKNSQGLILLQRRSEKKLLWPRYWSNSCCSHPLSGEGIEAAGQRRLFEELGMHGKCERLYSFLYREAYKNVGVEHELCHVLLSVSDSRPAINYDEVEEYRWLTIEEIDTMLEENPSAFTPWFIMEWSHLKAYFPEKLTSPLFPS